MYERLVKSSNAGSLEGLEALWKSNWKKDGLSAEVDHLWELEEEWDSFLGRVDSEGARKEDLLVPGDSVPNGVVLQNVREGLKESSLEEVVAGAGAGRVHLVLLRHFA